MKRVLQLLFILLGGIVNAQIGTQIYFATDSCEFYIPDYSEAVWVEDNCCDSTAFIQVPNSGTLLHPGDEVQITLYARDCYDNQSSMSFDLIVIDKVPPTFYYDSTTFAPLGQYQNDVRTWHFWTNIDSTVTRQDPPLYYSQKKSARDRTTGIGTEIHDAYYRNDTYYKMSLFMAKTTYRVTDMLMAISKVGNPQGELRVEIWQLNMDTTLLQPICGATMDLNNIVGRVSSDPQNVPAEELIWHTINLSDGILVRGGWYAIRTYCTGVDNDNRVIWNTTNYDIDNEESYQFLKYSYNDEETYGINLTSSYMYQMWGIDID
jgi:hypothetical protein